MKCMAWMVAVLLALPTFISAEEVIKETAKAAPVAKGETTFKTYNLKTSPDEAPAIIQALKEMLGDKFQIFHYKPDNQLLVSGTDEQLKLVEAMLGEINRPAANVRLDVAFREVGKQTDSSAGATLSGSVVVTKHGSSSTVKINPELRHQTTGTDSLNQQTLVVMSGREASIQISQQVPSYEYFMVVGQEWGIIEKAVVMEKAGSFLTAVPQVIGKGKMITVTLTPEIRELTGNNPQRIKFKRVATTVTVMDGATITIGGSTDNKEFYEQFLIGGRAGGTQSALNITLTARILNPDGTPANP